MPRARVHARLSCVQTSRACRGPSHEKMVRGRDLKRIQDLGASAQGRDLKRIQDSGASAQRRMPRPCDGLMAATAFAASVDKQTLRGSALSLFRNPAHPCPLPPRSLPARLYPLILWQLLLHTPEVQEDVLEVDRVRHRIVLHQPL